MKRDDVIKLLASMVTADGDYPHVVNLHEPDLMVVVEIVKVCVCVPSNLALDAQVNEETSKFNWLETKQISHSDTGL